MTKQTILKAENLSKTYQDQGNSVVVFENINFSIKEGTKNAIIGVSGSGKSTLLHVLSGLDKPTTGDVFLKGKNFSQCSEKERGLLRNKHLGFIYQFHHLLPEFTALDNVCMPLMIGGMCVEGAKETANKMLKKVGLSERVMHKPSALSGGERQRVAIARALVTNPLAVLADEPTGNLDADNAHAVFDLMCELNEEIGTALIVVTHDLKLADKMDTKWQISNRQLLEV